eukprot:UN06348
MKIHQYYLYDINMKRVGKDTDALQYIATCSVQLVVSLVVLLFLLYKTGQHIEFHDIFKDQIQKIKFAAMLWVLLLVLQIAYANFSHSAFFIHFFVNLFIYPIFFMWIICVLYALGSKPNKEEEDSEDNVVNEEEEKCTGCYDRECFLYVAIVFFSANAMLFVIYGVIIDIGKIHSKWHKYSYHLIFMMIVVENTLLLEALHLVFPTIIELIIKCCPCCDCCTDKQDDNQT